MDAKNIMMASSTTRPKFDRKTLPKAKDPESRSVGIRKISQITNQGSSFIRPRAGTLSKKDQTISVSSRDHDKNSSASFDHVHQKFMKYENTYKMEPDIKFQVEKVKNIIVDVLQSELQDEKYDPYRSARHCVVLSDTIKEKVKLLNMKRYKIICNVFITERANQSMSIASHFCWDKDNDNFASAYFNQPLLHAVGMVFGVYLN